MPSPAQATQRGAASCLYREWSWPDYPFPCHTVEVARGGTRCEAEWMPAPGESRSVLCVGLRRPDGETIDVSGVPGNGPVSLSEIRLIAKALLTLVDQIESKHPALDRKAIAIKEAVAEVCRRAGRARAGSVRRSHFESKAGTSAGCPSPAFTAKDTYSQVSRGGYGRNPFRFKMSR